MPRVKSNVARLKRKNKVMKLAKGYFGGRSKLWKAAKESVERAQKYAYRDRRRKKGDFRRLWIIRINAAARLHQLSYSRLMNGLRERLQEIPQADERRLPDLKTEILGRKAGALTKILAALPRLEPAAKKRIGAAANALKHDFEAAFATRERELKRAAAAAADVDLTMPGRARWPGGLHLVTQVVDEICEIFDELGFTRAVGPLIETERYNFYALNFPKDHPALDAQDSFYLGGDLLLRTHTSPVQIRTLERYPPPIRVVIPGQVYRRDPFDASHSPVFEQIEGLAVDEGISFVDFKATLATFARKFFTADTGVRFRPSFF